VNFHLAGGANTLNLRADSNNTGGVSGAVVDFFDSATFDGGTGTTSMLFGITNGTPNRNLLFANGMKVMHF
jgi:hypothetical protein